MTPSETDHVVIFAPAKVNLVLRVLDPRSDGYHNLWSIMQTLALHDSLRLEIQAAGAGVTLQCNDPSLATDSTNLIVRAAELILTRVDLSVGLNIQILKAIPMGAGLGGGSSDAAATMIGLNRLLQLGWSHAEMRSIGEGLGSDIPFFFSAPTAVVTGRGECITPLHLPETRWILLIKPDFPIETKWAYQQLSSMYPSRPPLSESATRVAAQGTVTWEEMFSIMENDFENVLFPSHRIVGDIKRNLLHQEAEAALLSGSGSTVFGVFNTEEQAARANAAIPMSTQWWTRIVPTSSSPLHCEPSRSPAPSS